jgi:prepilin-type N-terminal cleavage/methylation domain-containing protein
MNLSESRVKGFTLLEAMIVLVVVGVISALFVPVMGGAFAEHQLDAQEVALVRSLEAARTIAITTDTPITVCAIDRNNRCSNGSVHSWVVFRDCNNNREIDDRKTSTSFCDDIVYSRDEISDAHFVVTSTDDEKIVPHWFRFGPNGVPLNISSCDTIEFILNRGNLPMRRVIVNELGGIYSTSKNGDTVTQRLRTCGKSRIFSISKHASGPISLRATS